MDGADQDVDLVALDELVGVVGRFGRIGFVVDNEILDLAAPEFSAVFLDRQLDRVAQRGVGPGVRQHQPDLDLLLLRERRFDRQRQTCDGDKCARDGAEHAHPRAARFMPRLHHDSSSLAWSFRFENSKAP